MTELSRPRYYVTSRYHVWTLRDRIAHGEPRAYFGARQYGGDAPAREAARAACNAANRRPA